MHHAVQICMLNSIARKTFDKLNKLKFVSSNVPIVKQFAWISIIPQLLVIGILSFMAYFFGFNEILNLNGFLANLMYGAIGQCIIWFGVRAFVMKFHIKAISLFKQEKFEEAIPFLEESLKIFRKYSWIDKYRYFLGSTSKISFREADLNNLAFCYGQIGEKEKSIEYYKITINEFPDSGVAKAALNFINTIETNASSK